VPEALMTDKNEKPRAYNPSTVWPVPEGFANIYSHAVEAQGFLFISGQIGLDVENRLSLDFEEQCEQVFSNVEALLEAAETAVENIVKVTYYLTRADHLPVLAEVRRRRWSVERPPAVSTLVVASLVHPEVLIEIDVVAVKGT
jgi:2-iminobutanoate/2-iminopropanoate deaminase